MNIKGFERLHKELSKNWQGYNFETMKCVDNGMYVVRITTYWHKDINMVLVIDGKNGVIVSYDLTTTPYTVANAIVNEYAELLGKGVSYGV